MHTNLKLDLTASKISLCGVLQQMFEFDPFLPICNNLQGQERTNKLSFEYVSAIILYNAHFEVNFLRIRYR
jgi:hypothetical protein